MNKILKLSYVKRSLTLLLISIFVLVGCQSEKKQEPEKLTKLSLRLKWIAYAGFGNHYVALEKGFYKNEGLDVTINPGGPGVDTIRVVASGADDIGIAAYHQILMARENDVPIIAIGEILTRNGVGFMSLKKSGIEKPQDFVGRKIGTTIGKDPYAIYLALLNKMNIDRDKLKEIPVGFDLTPLLIGTVDVFPVFITQEPIIARLQGYEVNVIDPYDYGISTGGNVWFTSEAKLKEKRDVIKSFLRAELKAFAASLQMSNEEVVDIVMKYNKQLDKKSEILVWQAFKDLLFEKDLGKLGFLYENKWKETADIFSQYKVINTVPDLSKCYTNELIEEIHKEGF